MALTITIPGAVETTTGSTAPAVLTVGVGAPGVGVPSGGTTGQVLQKLSATSYDTGWATPAADFITSVTAPLAVGSGVLSVDLSAYLTTSAAASTYYLQTNPDGFITSAALTGYATESFVTSQGYITQVTADGLYYPLSGNPSAFITASALTPYLTTADAATTYYLQTNPSNFQTGADVATSLSPYLLSSTAASTYYLQTNPDGFITFATLSPYALLASPTFTGTPTLPTGSIGVTQSPGNNTTALATTAFVTAAVPAFATLTDVIGTPSSTTLALNPSLAPWVMANANVRYFGMLGFTSVSGGGASNYGTLRDIYTTGASQRSTYLDAPYGSAGYGMKSSTDAANINFSKKVWVFGVFFPGSPVTSPSYIGDANTTCRINLGGRSAVAVGNLTQKGIGLFKAGGIGSLIYLTVHNGTTLTSVSSGVTNATGQTFKYVIYSDGTGNVTLYLDGVSVATTSAGPTGMTVSGYSIYEEQVETSATFSVRQAMGVTGAGLIIER